MSGQVRLLIVDDNEDVLIGLERSLEDDGYATTTAWGGHDALRLSAGAQFDLLLIDEHLHGLNSAALVDELRQLQPGAFLLLMHARKNAVGKTPGEESATVCKWEPDEVKAKIRSYMAA